MQTKMLYLQALTPLHAGTGQGVGVIDLPIAREKATNLPFLPGSSVKGSLRDLAQADAKGNTAKEKNFTNVFGPDTKAASEHASAVQFTDQRLLALPVRSLRGTFAWVTSPFILRRLARDAKDANINNFNTLPFPSIVDDNCLLATGSVLRHTNNRAYLEDLDLNAGAQDSADARRWADALARCYFKEPQWQQFFSERFCLVSDNIMGFLAETATEVQARIKLLDDTKTVQDGGLWYEEALPTETLLYGLVLAAKIQVKNEKEVFDLVGKLIEKPAQFGGKATIGRGLCRLTLSA